MILTVSQARQLVGMFGVWPPEHMLVIPHPPMMWYILPSPLEWRRN